MKRKISVLLALFLLLSLSSLLCLPASADGEVTEDISALYVEDGLVLCVTLYDASLYQGESLLSGGRGALSVDGLWERSPDGRGITYSVPNEFSYSSAGLSFDKALLGAGDYTLEMTADPYGVLDSETGEPYDGAEDILLRSDGAFVLGPLRMRAYPAAQGVNYSHSLYYYYQSGATLQGEHLSMTNFFDTVDGALSFSVTHQRTSGARYELYGDGHLLQALSIAEEDVIPAEAASGACRLLYGFPATFYALRLYDRVLTDEERAQNHLADLCGYHGIAPSSFLPLLSEQERAALMQELAEIPLSADASRVRRVISSYLYGALEDAAFRTAAERYSLDILAYLADPSATAAAAVAAIPTDCDVTAYGVQRYFDLLLAGEEPLAHILSFLEYTTKEGSEIPAVEARFSVDTALLRLVELSAPVTLGVAVGYGGAYQTADALTVNEALAAGEHAASYIAYKTGEGEAPTVLTMRVLWDVKEYQTRKGYKEEIVFRAFAAGADEVLYTEAAEASDTRVSMFSVAKQLVCDYEGDRARAYAYNADPLLRAVLKECNLANIPTLTLTEDEMRLEELKKQLADGLAATMAVSEVRYCGRKYDSYDTPAVWVEYLADAVSSDSRIRPAYVYLPSKVDPTLYGSEANMKNAGVLRVFAYIGSPTAASYYPNDTFPGMVCVHGGGGQAYIKYVQEAINHGYFAIALDTDGETRKNPTSPDGSGDEYFVDVLGIAKDSLQNSRADIEEQWQYFVQRAIICCNTVLRSLSQVDENAVGITGISWGGFAVTTNIQYDDRYAFAVPVYISGYTEESLGMPIGGMAEDTFRAALWQDEERLSRIEMPVLLINGDDDPYASLNTTLRTYYAIPNAEMCTIRGYTHSQQKGASRSEIYLFGERVLGYKDALPAFTGMPEDVTTRRYTLSLTENVLLKDYKVTLYYQTEPIVYTGIKSYAGSKTRLPWEELQLTVGEDGSIEVIVPDEAVVYYVAVSAYYAPEAVMPTVYVKYTGEVFASSPLIPVGCPGMYD